MRTAILIVTVVTGIIIFFAAYYFASAQPQDSPGYGCVRDPRDDSWSCVDGDR